MAHKEAGLVYGLSHIISCFLLHSRKRPCVISGITAASGPELNPSALLLLFRFFFFFFKFLFVLVVRAGTQLTECLPKLAECLSKLAECLSNTHEHWVCSPLQKSRYALGRWGLRDQKFKAFRMKFKASLGYTASSQKQINILQFLYFHFAPFFFLDYNFYLPL